MRDGVHLQWSVAVGAVSQLVARLLVRIASNEEIVIYGLGWIQQ